MGNSMSFPKEEEFLLPQPRDPRLLDGDRFPASNDNTTIQTFCVRAGEDVLGPAPAPGTLTRQPDGVTTNDAPKVLRVYGVSKDGNRITGFQDGNQGFVSLLDMSNNLVAAWEFDPNQNYTTIYSRRPFVPEGSSAGDRVPVPVWRGAGMESPQQLYPFARVEGGYKDGQKNKPFTVKLATGGARGQTPEAVFENAEVGYRATGLGGHFWKIIKEGHYGHTVGACVVVPANMHYGSACSPSGAQAVRIAPGMDPLLLLTIALIKNMKVIGSLPEGHSGLGVLEKLETQVMSDPRPYQRADQR